MDIDYDLFVEGFPTTPLVRMPSLQALQTLSLGQASGIGGKKGEGVI